MRLRRLNGEGASRIIADAPLDDRHLAADGFASCAADTAEGLLEAEIGLCTAAGGWALVARSNRLQAITSTGVPFLRDSASPSPAPAAVVTDPARMPVSVATALPSQRADSAATAFPLVPQVRQPKPELDGGIDSRQPSAEMPTVMPQVRGGGGEFSLAADGRLESHALMVSSGEAPWSTEPSDFAPSAEPNPSPSPGAALEPSITPSIGSSAAPSRPAAGSGPMLAFRADAGGEIGAELLVHGSAAPGSLLDLGGHSYRVGAGGRFSFRVPLTDRDLIMRLLAMLPELLVESRADDGY